MLRVIRKDLILNRNVIVINALIFATLLGFFATRATRTPAMLYAGFAAFMMAFLPMVIVTREDKFNAMALGCSLPVSRKTIVRARFAFALGAAFLGITVALLLAGYIPGTSYGAGEMFGEGPLVVAFGGISFVLAVLLPFTLRFGMKGVLIFLVVMQVLGVVLLTVTQITGSTTDKRIVNAVITFFARTHAALGPAGFDLLLGALLVVLLGLSYVISVRAFEGREL